MVNHQNGDNEREYVGQIWVDRKPVKDFRITASSLTEARRKAVAEHGDKNPIAIWNVDDARTTRGSAPVTTPLVD